MSEANEGAPEGVTQDATAADQVAEDTQVQGDEPIGDDAPAPEAETPEQTRKRTARERVEQAVARQREAEREAEFWKSKALQATPQQPAREAQEHTPQEASRPDPDDFDNDFDFIEALTDWKAEQAAARLAEATRQQDRAKSIRQNFETRKSALFPQGDPDGLQHFMSLPTLPSAVIEIVGESDIGPKIADHLGANPAELRRLEGMSPIQQARELTRLEMRLSQPAKPTPKTATDAPEPLPQARGTGGRFAVAPDTDDFAAFDKNYG